MPKNITHGWTTSQPDNPDKDVSADELNDHSEVYSGLTPGHVLRASGATAADFAALQDADLPATIARDSEVTSAVDAIEARHRPVSIFDFSAANDYVTDDTASLNAAIAFALTTGRATVEVGENHRINGQIVIPNDGASPPTQKSLKLVGSGMWGNTNNGGGQAPQGGSRLDMRYTGSDARIVSLGGGTLEISGISFTLTGGTTPLLLTTNTTLHFHHNAVHGDPAKTGTGCDQDAIILGGTSTGFDGTVNSSFQGYGSVISDNHFDRIRRLVYGRTHCNDVKVIDNVAWQRCGSNLAGGAAIELLGSGSSHSSGNTVRGNTIEVINYPYAVKLTTASKNALGPNGIYDQTATHLAAYRFEASGEYNLVIDGYRDDAKPLISEDATVANRNLAITAHQSQATKWTQPFEFLNTVKKVNANAVINTDGMTLEDSTGNQFVSSFPVIGGGFPGYRFYYIPSGGSQEAVGDFQRASATDKRMTLYGSTANWIRTPNGPLRIACLAGQTLFLGDTTTQGISITGGTKLIASGGLVTSSGVTGSRPASPSTGQVYFDTTLGLPIWWNGTAWVEAVDLAAHLADTADAHDASAISILDTANDFTATDVEGALAELQSDAETHAAAADPHSGYVLESLYDAKGDLISASAADTPAKLTAAANGATLTTASGETTGLKWRLNNDAATAAPTINDDAGDGYAVGSRWIDTTNDQEWVCLDATTSAAVWSLASAPFDVYIGSYDPRVSHINQTFPTANAARLMAVTVQRPTTVANLYVRIAVASGNICAGIYDDTGVRLATSGLIACPSATQTVAIAMGASVILQPGRRYWFALAADNTTASFASAASAVAAPSVPGRITNGQVTTSMPLPDPIVLPTTQVSLILGVWA